MIDPMHLSDLRLLDDYGDETLVLALLRQDLTKKGRSEDTVTAYTAAARRFEDFVRNQDPSADPELLQLDEAIEFANQFRSEVLEGLKRPSLYAYESALAAYLEALDQSFTRDRLIFVQGAETGEERKANAGRRPPSTPLTDNELFRLRRRHNGRRHPLWLRTVIELAVTGLRWDEIMAVTSNQVSHFGNPPLIMLLERTIPIYETKTAEWLDTRDQRIYPNTANRGQPISLRLAKRELAATMNKCRKDFPGQGLRALHRTGARRLLRRGKSPDEVASIYPRSGVRVQLPAKAA